jgi:hypothetical protein
MSSAVESTEIITLTLTDSQHRQLEGLLCRQGAERDGLLLAKCRPVLLLRSWTRRAELEQDLEFQHDLWLPSPLFLVCPSVQVPSECGEPS